ncbi:sulfide dehydrogenase [flavocytochrome C] flavoprotein chain precursor [Piscinibacter sakaiensis]|uniref:Sulfide dehydrogenase [flavocytochrome C] flavoprotein chain n=2 Tax=Piscinibacter sakaiensis TaxID=1547922 RepID=A0A0K8P7Y4_PISS1|nr:NAD(P)/FAD-dependent oxidoreductase [Piscinibacter sakaiensis]GAP38737.1 sulfide dehydrogenase [flavocytochrome C] flavoprotein chain precursor [Piscinibacter sakaiensis]
MEHARTMGRRRLLGATAAWSGLAAAGLAGCATPPAGGAVGRVVVVGGGFGGSTAARYLRLWDPGIAVTLVERQPRFVSCPISNLVVGGFRRLEDVTLGYDGLRAQGVEVVQGEVVAIDAAARQVRLAGGRSLPYDRLVLSPGVDFLWDAIGGLQQAVDRGEVMHAWKAGPQTLALRARLEAMRDGGVYALSIPKSPYRCPPGPYERACMVAAYFKQHKPRSKVLVLDANAEVQSKKALFEKAFREHYAGLLEYRPNSELKDVAGSTARLEFEDVRADVLNVVPIQRAADIARSTGLVNVNQRWVGVNWQTMESQVAQGIHVLGDATFSAPLMPKSGHMANQHAKVAAAAIVRALRGEPPPAAPVVMNTCYSFVTPRDVIHVASVHQYDAAEKTFRTVPGSGGVSAAATEQEGRYALSWADNIWADMLAV